MLCCLCSGYTSPFSSFTSSSNVFTIQNNKQENKRISRSAPKSVSMRCNPLEIECKVNGQKVLAMIDTGAEISVVSSHFTDRYDLTRFIDTSYAGKAIGVGCGQILGRLANLPFEIGPMKFESSVSVLKNSRVDVIIGLDILRRYSGDISLLDHSLKFHYANKDHVKIPFFRRVIDQQGFMQNLDSTKEQVDRCAVNNKDILIPSDLRKNFKITDDHTNLPSRQHIYLYTNTYDFNGQGLKNSQKWNAEKMLKGLKKSFKNNNDDSCRDQIRKELILQVEKRKNAVDKEELLSLSGY